MAYVIPANCQVRAGGHTVTFNREQRIGDPVLASSVVEMDGKPVDPGTLIPRALMQELNAMVNGA